MTTKLCKCMKRLQQLAEDIGEEEMCNILVKAKAKAIRLKVKKEK